MPLFSSIAWTLTHQAVLSLVLLTLCGIGWLLLGRTLPPLLVAKRSIVAAVWEQG